MITKIKQSLFGGIVGTAVMSTVMLITTRMGMPKLSPPEMLSMMMGFSITVGWLMHFMIGIIFAATYFFFFKNVVKKINNKILKGAIFGFSVFVFALIAMAIIGAMMGGMPPMEGSVMLLMIGGIIGHVVFGMTVALFAKGTVTE